MKCLSCLQVISQPSFCIVCADPYCDQCRTDFMCHMCKLLEETETDQQNMDARLMPITCVLGKKLLREDKDALEAMVNDWKNGKISDVDRRLRYLSLKLKDSTLRYIQQIEDVLCDAEYEVDQSLLEDDPYRLGMRHAKVNFAMC